MTTIKNYAFLLLSAGILLIAGCKKKEGAMKTPTLSTSAVTNITANGATGGGTISDNGGDAIIASGICWSKTNNLPTISDDTTKGTTASGSFVSKLGNLDPSATYYVRAYATNSIGTGYGSVVTFGTGNGVPEARGLKITGTLQVGSVLTANYTYFDAENNPESGTVIQWYVANDTIGAAVTPIGGASAKTFTLSAEAAKFIRLGVTPKSSAGASPGTEMKSYWVGPIGAEMVTFMYNGQSVSYGVLVSSTTGRKWLDRNLGAKKVATAYDDYQGYGDLFQWGRPADGHQLINWTSSINGTPINGSTTILSSTNTPGHTNFITSATAPWDWRSTPNEDLLTINSPCPAGWHIPTNIEWSNEQIKTIQAGFEQLKLVGAGLRNNSGEFQVQKWGRYWSSSISGPGYGDAFILSETERASNLTWPPRGSGYSCRCIKNQ